MDSIIKNRILANRIKGKVVKIDRLKSHAFSVNLFYEKGNGIKTLKERTGRLNDIKGLFVIFTHRNRPMIVGKSKMILSEIQKLVRGKRKMDREQLESIANQFGYQHWKAGQSYLRNMKVCWVEVTRDIDLKALEYIFTRKQLV